MPVPRVYRGISGITALDENVFYTID